MGPATMSGTKITLDVAGQPFVANGTVLAEQALERFIPLALRKDDQIPDVGEGEIVLFSLCRLMLLR